MKISVIIYTRTVEYLNKTIDSLLDNTPNDLIKEIIVCIDSQESYGRNDVAIFNSDNIGRAKAWNTASEFATGECLIFINGIAKYSEDWIQPLIEAIDQEPTALVSPVVHILNAKLWSSEPNRWKRFGFRWDLKIYDRPSFESPETPIVSSNCIVVRKDRFNEIGKFDNGMILGNGEDIELSIRNWLLDGFAFVIDESIIAVLQPNEENSDINRSRIAEVWLQRHSGHYYNNKDRSLDIGRLTELLKIRDKQSKSIDWYLENKLPELFTIYRLKNTATEKRVIVIGPSHSMDYVHSGFINSNDILIGIDYMGLLYNCDYVMTDSVIVANELKRKYDRKQFVIPITLEDNVTGKRLLSSEIIKGSTQFDLDKSVSIPLTIDPPFCNFGNMTLTAIHLALFMNASMIFVVGCDNKLYNGLSHTTKLEYYNGGNILFDSDSTNGLHAYHEYCLNNLGKLGLSLGIPILRLSHI